MNVAPGIRIAQVHHSLEHHRVFSDLSLSLPGGQWHGLLGRSGMGKSTLLRLIAGLEQPDAGSIASDTGEELERQVSYMSQDDGLLPWLSVLDNVQLGPRLRRHQDASTRQRAAELLQWVDLTEWARALPDQLSGGMRQRVALARTLLENRPVVLMDEPFSRLDAITRHELQTLSARLLGDRTVVLVTHDPAEALRLAHTVTVLYGTQPTQLISQSLYTPPPRATDEPEVLNGMSDLWEALNAMP